MSSERRDRLRGLLTDQGDGLLVTSLADIRYLTGFSGSNAALFISSSGADGDIFCTDGRYVEQAAEQCPDLGVLVARACVSATSQQCVDQGAREVSVDRGVAFEAMESLSASGLSARVIESPVAILRARKDAAEIASLERANLITSYAVDALVREIAVGDTEVHLARRLEQLFGEMGAEDRAFPTIVATGANSAKPHHEPGATQIAVGDLLVIDSGARVAGYHADMTRTFVVGDPSSWQMDLHALVARAAASGRSAVRAGVSCAELDSSARDVIVDAGYGEYFGHGLGHGTGLEIHEAPMIGPRSEGRLTAETTITVEPGVYLPGRGGVRIEDSLLVTADGHRSLTTSPRDLRIVG